MKAVERRPEYHRNGENEWHKEKDIRHEPSAGNFAPRTTIFAADISISHLRG
jgi:hypothetical protein